MQSKGLIRFFLIILTIVCLIQFLFLVPTCNEERKADRFAESKVTTVTDDITADTTYKRYRSQYLDSISSETVLSIPLIKDYTYEDLKKQQLAFGLDLKGGMSVILQVDLRDFLDALSNHSSDPAFRQSLDNATERIKTDQSDYITLFADEYRKTGSEVPLAEIFTRNESMRERVSSTASNGEVIANLRELANQTVNLTYDRLKTRIDKFGVVQPNVSLDAARHLIVIELPGIENPERARRYLQATAKLEFWDVYRANDPGVMQSLFDADQALKERSTNSSVAETKIDTIYTPQYDSLGNEVGQEMRIDTVLANPLDNYGPIVRNMSMSLDENSQPYATAIIGYVDKNKRDDLHRLLTEDTIAKPFFPKDIIWMFSTKPANLPNNEKDVYEVYAIKKSPGKAEAPLEGDHITRAFTTQDPVTGDIVVSLKMDNTGTKKWGEMTSKNAQDGNREIAIALDNEVVSAPRVNQPILTGSSQISGGFSVQEATDLANILEVGKLPAKTHILSESLVGPSLGKENIQKSVNSIVIAFFLLLVFMVLYYGGGGWVSIIALLANLFFIIGIMSSWGVVLTLPGIAGIVLTLGMAVDANVIIYERIREELRDGKGLKTAISDGFSNSYSAIIDANVTTLITAFVLAFFGIGPIKGFATVLIIGVLCSLITAVLLTKLIIDWWIGRKGNMSFSRPFSKNVMANPKVDWIGMRKKGYIFSGLLIAAGLISMFTRGFELGVDFTGGFAYNVELADDTPYSVDDMRQTLTDVFGSEPVVKSVSGNKVYNVTTKYLVKETDEDIPERVLAKLFEGFNTLSGGTLDYEKFKNPESSNYTHIESSSKVGPTIAKDIKRSSFISAIIALVLIFLYLAFRFNRWQFSMGAVLALFHDVLVVLSIYSLFKNIMPFSMEIDQAFVAAILTVIGYSVNDTVIVFDRIREFLNSYIGRSKEEVFNLAINSTLSRTLITSTTTLIVIFILFMFGGASIKGFAFAILIGILSGTYSSIFIASAAVIDLTDDTIIQEVKSTDTKLGKDTKKKNKSKTK